MAQSKNSRKSNGNKSTASAKKSTSVSKTVKASNTSNKTAGSKSGKTASKTAGKVSTTSASKAVQKPASKPVQLSKRTTMHETDKSVVKKVKTTTRLPDGTMEYATVSHYTPKRST